MLGDNLMKKKSSHRLSSLFSSGSSDSAESKNTKLSPVPSNSGSRLTKVRQRMSSATHLAPEYPVPPTPKSPREVSLSNPTIQPIVESATDLEPLEPPSFDAPSRTSSPFNSRPGTPTLTVDTGSEGKLKKLRRKSGLFGGTPVGGDTTAGAPQGHASPLAWIVGHKGKVPYNLTFLLNGEKVGELGSTCVVPSVLTT
jgi:hypothetical protein